MRPPDTLRGLLCGGRGALKRFGFALRQRKRFSLLFFRNFEPKKSVNFF